MLAELRHRTEEPIVSSDKISKKYETTQVGRQKRLCKMNTIRSDESVSKRIDKKKKCEGLDYDERVKQGNREDKSEV